MNNVILVANRANARLYRSANLRSLELIQNFDNPEGRQKGSELQTDDSGRSFESADGARHVTQPETDVHTQVERRFAQELVAQLEKVANHDGDERLILVAAPHFLGELRNKLSETLKRKIVAEVNKDLPPYVTESEILERLQQVTLA